MRPVRLGFTLGPACDDPAVLAAILRAGFSLARLNFSHSNPAAHARRLRRLRRVSRETGRPVAVLGDLQGPRMRIGTLPGGVLALEAGAGVELAIGVERAEAGVLPLPWAPSSAAFRRGLALAIDDGSVLLRVERSHRGRVRCRVERGGTVADRKGVNAPGPGLEGVAPTAKDRRDLTLAARLRCDALALSFVGCAADVDAARAALDRAGRAIPLVAKIERPRGWERLGEIADAADGVLVARGDLGVEFPLERLPALQRGILRAAGSAGKPGIVAGHLLASMKDADRPTRAEVLDVARALDDGASALLLTGETAAGAHPVAAAHALADIVEASGSGSGTGEWWS